MANRTIRSTSCTKAVCILAVCVFPVSTMTLTRRYLGCLLFLSMLLTACSPAWAEQGLLLNQETKVFGEMEALISPIGVRVVNERLKTVTVSSAPDWKIVSYNPKTKLCFIVDDIKHFRSALIFSNDMFSGFNLETVPMRRNGSSTDSGLPTARYESTPPYAASQMASHLANEITGSAALIVDYDSFEQTKMPRSACDILAHIYGVPRTPGVPASLWYESCDKNKHKYLVTVSVKVVSCSKKDFDYPKDYRRVQSEGQLNNVSNTDFEELFHK
jgi:hypothetical protein